MAPGDDATLTYSGIGVYSPQMFAQVLDEVCPLRPLLQMACAGGRVSGARYDGQWEDIGTPQRLDALNQLLSIRS